MCVNLYTTLFKFASPFKFKNKPVDSRVDKQ